MLLPLQGDEALATESTLNQPLIQHRIQDGDTLWELSQSYGVPAEAIAVSNALQESEVLPVGKTLQIPALALAAEAPDRQQPVAETVSDPEIIAVEDVSLPSEPQIVAAAQTEAEPLSDEATVAVQKDLDKVAVEPEPRVVAAVEVDAPEPIVTEPQVSEPQISEPQIVVDDIETPSIPADAAVHHIAPGETLVALAEQYETSVDELVEHNPDTEPTQLQVGQQLVVPNTPSAADAPELIAQSRTARAATPTPVASSADHIRRLKADVMRMREQIRSQNEPQPTVVESEVATATPQTQEPVATPAPNATPVHPEWERQQLNKPSREGSSQELIAAAPVPSQGYNRLLQLPAGQTVEPQIPPLLEQDQYLPDDAQTFNGHIWPTRGTLTSGYGPRWGRMHRGIDIAAPTGTPIHASAAGEVVSAGWNSGGYGNLVEIRHPDGSLTRYAHNSRVLVRKGDRVTQGQQIALMGSTGYSTGPHLHFELHPAGRGAVNPMAFLPAR